VPAVKPPTCSGCALEHKGLGFAPPDGPSSAQVAFIAEALGKYEAYKGINLIGPAGNLTNRLLRMLGRERSDIRVANIVACQPPRDWLDGAPWERAAISHCRRHLEPVLNEPRRVVLALGGSSMRSLLGLPKAKNITVENFHGYAVPEPQGRFWVVPSFHPAAILRDGHNLTGVLLHDMRVAFETAEHGWQHQAPSLVVDPPLDWLRRWVDAYLAAQDSCWLALDIETPDKDAAEDELEVGGAMVKQIIRINFAYSTEEGITIPWVEPYLGEVRRLLGSRGIKLVWNGSFDLPVLAGHGFVPSGSVYDGMWCWHVLQSDLPKRLGFVGSFYGCDRPWKHLASSDFGIYSALDAVNTMKCCYGIASDLQREGMWEVFERHVYQLDTWGLRPAEAVGLACNRSGLERLGQDMAKEIARLEGEIKALVPDAAKPIWAPSKAGWSKPPSAEMLAKIQAEDGMEALPEIIERQVEREVLCCRLCGGEGVTRSHNCAKKIAAEEAKLARAAARVAKAEQAASGGKVSRKSKKGLTQAAGGVD